MTVATTTSKSGPYAGAGTTGPFTVNFRFLDNEHLQVIKTSTMGMDSTLLLDNDYTVAGAGADSGTVTLAVALAVGESLTILRNVPTTQETDYVQNDAFPAQSHEEALDKLTMITQQLKEQADRSLTLPPTVTGASTMLPAPESNQIIGWNLAGNELQNYPLAQLASAIAFATYRYDTFDGDGVETEFTLTSDPVTLGNMDVSINGVTQVPGTDYTLVDGVLVFLLAPANGTVVLARYGQAVVSGPSADALNVTATDGAGGTLWSNVQGFINRIISGIGSGFVGHTPEGTDALPTTVESALNRRAVSLLRWTDDRAGSTDIFDAALAAWTYCLANGYDLYIPSGRYVVKRAANWPFGRINGLPPASLLDCKNITIFGDGPSTILETETVGGADVLQFNGAKNLHVRNLKLKSTISGSVFGSNGISITGGGDNITADHIWCEDLAYIDKGTFVDGGKAFTIQTPVAGQTVPLGTIKATNIFAKGCVYGFGYELDLVAASTMDVSIDVDVVAEDCRDAVIISAAGASAALPADWRMGVRVKAQAINCQADVILSRVHGADIDCQVITTKTAAQRLLSYNGTPWFAADTADDVVALIATYAKNSSVNIYGNKGECGYKALIGGTTAGSSGLGGNSANSQFKLDIAGAATLANVSAVNSGGNVLNDSLLLVTSTTGATIDSAFYTVAADNTIQMLGESGQNLLHGNVRFPAAQVASTDPNTLDDYEEGVFTPILADTGLVAEGATYSIQVGRYTKIGNIVHFNLTLALSGLGTLTGTDAAFVIGLPFASLNTSNNFYAFNVSFTSGLNMTAAALMQARMTPNTSHIELRKTAFSSTTGDAAMTVNEVSSDGVFVISGSYRTS